MTDNRMQDSQSAPQGDRLPCRGCSASCPHYATCDGKPWRMDAEVVEPSHD